MEQKSKFGAAIKNFRIKQGVEASDQNLMATIHLMNDRRIDINAALDQSSRGPSDKGIDAWDYDAKTHELYIYQSKFSESKYLVLDGLNDLLKANRWLEEVLVSGKVSEIPTNPVLYTLYALLSKDGKDISKITFTLLSLFDHNELEDREEYRECERALTESKLNEFLSGKRAKMVLKADVYSLDSSLPSKIKKYKIGVLEESIIHLNSTSKLELAYIPLTDLIRLYRERGDILFDKNVRLSLFKTKEATQRLVHPMNDTFDAICSGSLSPNIFPFYHVGVTIAASKYEPEGNNLLSLEAPDVINGCQTIVIADAYERKLQDNKGIKEVDKQEQLNRFNQIKVIAKIVIGTTDEQLREITNSNNRQNPIENWQLFSNDPIHIEIELALKDNGVFYQRQEGKHEAIMSKTENVQAYFNTGTGAYVGVTYLGQLICISRKNIQWAAKPSEIFLNKKNHDNIFDQSIPKYAKDIVLVSNLFKAIKRNVSTITEGEKNPFWVRQFKKPLIKTYIYYIALLKLYQSEKTEMVALKDDYQKTLYKFAQPKLVTAAEPTVNQIIYKFKAQYPEITKGSISELSSKELDRFLSEISIALGIDIKDRIPFTTTSKYPTT